MSSQKQFAPTLPSLAARSRQTAQGKAREWDVDHPWSCLGFFPPIGVFGRVENGFASGILFPEKSEGLVTDGVGALRHKKNTHPLSSFPPPSAAGGEGKVELGKWRWRERGGEERQKPGKENKRKRGHG